MPTVAVPSISEISVAAIMRCELPAIAARMLLAPSSGVISRLLRMNVAVEMRNSAPTSAAVRLFADLTGVVASTGMDATAARAVVGPCPLVVVFVSIMICPPWGFVDFQKWRSDGDDNRSARMSLSDMSDCLGCPTQWVGSVDDRRDLPGFDQFLQDDEVLSVLKFDGRTTLLAHELRHSGCFDDGTHGAEPTTTRRSIVGVQPSGGGERMSGVGQRMVPDVVEDEVVALPTLGEVLTRVIDDMVSADGADHVHVPRAAYACHFGA